MESVSKAGLITAFSLFTLLFSLMMTPAEGALVEQCSWEGSAVEPESNDVMHTPVVLDLTGDGAPEVAFLTFADNTDQGEGEDGILRVISGESCEELFSVVDVGSRLCVGEAAPFDLNERGGNGILDPSSGVAAGDIDNDGLPEILAFLEGPTIRVVSRIIAFEHDGTFKWCSEAAETPMHRITQMALADLDGDGTTEIVAGAMVFNADGSIRWEQPVENHEALISVVADLDVDGSPEIVTGNRAFRADGTILWDRPDLNTFRVFPGIADFDLDGWPEVVNVVNAERKLYLLNGQNGTDRCSVEIPTESPDWNPCVDVDNFGGPPTIADRDGDCIPEVGIATGAFYALFEYYPEEGCFVEQWAQPVQDCSSRNTGSTMFDLEGDGSIEVLYNDELHFRIYRASDGEVLEEISNSSGTVFEYPTLADADDDGHAEIVLAANDFDYCCEEGLRILHDSEIDWVASRKILNQHSYHITNINDDATIPAVEENNWEVYNNFRVQIFPWPCNYNIPGAECPPECRVSCQSPYECEQPSTLVLLEGEGSDPDDEVVYEWALCGGEVIGDDPIIPYEIADGPGAYCFAFTVTTIDGEESTSCELTITVQDTTPPALTLPEPQTLECAGPAGSFATVAASAEDGCSGTIVANDVRLAIRAARSTGISFSRVAVI